VTLFDPVVAVNGYPYRIAYVLYIYTIYSILHPDIQHLSFVNDSDTVKGHTRRDIFGLWCSENELRDPVKGEGFQSGFLDYPDS
jgi:hypothetical protein